jgi:hypothetical protein
MILGFLFSGIILFTGGAGIPALGLFISKIPELGGLGLTAGGVTTAFACLAMLAINMLSESICCNVLHVKGCCVS